MIKPNLHYMMNLVKSCVCGNYITLITITITITNFLFRLMKFTTVFYYKFFRCVNTVSLLMSARTKNCRPTILIETISFQS